MKYTFLKYSLCGLAILGGMQVSVLPLQAQTQQQAAQTYTVSGVVYNDLNQPVADAIISTSGQGVIRTDESGRFELKGLEAWATVKVSADGYYVKTIRVQGNATDLPVYLINLSDRNYNEDVIATDGTTLSEVADKGVVENVGKKDFSLGAVTLEKALQGKMTGLQITQKSGMPGEGAYFSLRGIRSLVSDNAPLIVINGVPYMADDSESTIVGGYSRSVFQTINPQDIANVTLLKGAEAAAYGSMGSNGVLLIETDGAQSDNVDTKLSFVGSVGTNWQNSRIPLMNASEYKSYMSDIAMDYYGNDMGAFFAEFPFMASASANNANLYQFDTDWQDEIFDNSMTHDYLFRVEGGDAIAKYDISLGYTGDQGTLKNTKSDRYHAQINSNVLVSKQFEINASINLSYLDGEYQEQGYSLETNPLLAAYRRSPLLSPYKSNGVPDANGVYGLLDTPSSYYLGASTNTDFIVSNPISLVNSLNASIRQYDMNAKLQLVYKPTTEWTFSALVGLYTNYDKESIFIPGVNNSDIVPRFDKYGESVNTVRVGEGDVFNMYYGVNAAYNKVYNNRHHFVAKAAFQVMTTSTEYDMAVGRNTANDFYQTMGDTQDVGRYFEGYNYAWNWINGNVSAAYTYGNWANVGVVASLDGASSTGKDADRMHFFPAAYAKIMLANLPKLNEVSWLNKLDVFADYSITGNSRYSSKYGKYYYTSQPYQTIAGIIRANVPNTELDVEVDKTLNVGVDLSVLRNRLSAKVGYYQTDAEDVVMLGTKSSAMGTTPYYCNDAAISSKGLEVAFQAVPYANKNFRWTVGGNLTTLANEVESLGNVTESITTLSDDAQIISRVGENPYAFYGYQTDGVISTSAEANELALVNRNSVAYQAGDVKYIDQNGDHIINDADKVVLGSATPDFFGSFYTSFEYKGWALDLNFVYSVGNDAYNAVRRINESSSDFSNQSRAVNRRWQNEGDLTDMPRANWGDVIGNNDFSDRFVEDASYLKLRDITVSYSFNKKVWNFFQSGTIYVTGQNLICFSDYLGMDPEFSYSYSTAMQGVDYGKVALPKSVKVGVNLKF